ncbi:hypothetical protein [Pseudomonas sp. TNT2022 ID642]|uniref:hypothetical protein n=1 Tax=Pseudomonas sp. TNT2022 ID642 TaxID=2942632 RepID=UPI00235EB150|nr:hypothetical protein [Pseudomonas sp. TNT2022 ID642]MDD1000628.1 hypothetical protein [Pseudomonas sp. TNT2022 ID642]
MPFDPIYSPTILSIIAASLLMLALLTCGLFLSGEFTRPVVIFLGVCLICLGAYGHVQFMEMQTEAVSLINENQLSQSVYDNFLKYQAIFTYLFPAISAAIGTNVISDALLKHHTYQRSFSVVQFIKDCSQLIVLPVGVIIIVPILLFWIVASSIPTLRRKTGPIAKVFFRRLTLKLLKFDIITRHKFRKKARSADIATS